MRKGFLSLLFVFVSMITKNIASSPQGCRNVPRLKMKLLYLRIIKISRLLSLSFLGMGVCLVFLLSSIIIFNITIFFYAPYSIETKMWLGFISASIYLLLALVAFVFVFTQKQWLYMFNAENILKDEMGIAPLEKTDPKSSLSM